MRLGALAATLATAVLLGWMISFSPRSASLYATTSVTQPVPVIIPAGTPPSGSAS